MRYYLAKSEPETRLERGVDVSFPLSRLASSPSQRTTWEGVRNPVAGKTLKGMAIGDQVLFYHSNCKLPGIAGLTEVSGEPRPDDSAWNPVGRCAQVIVHPEPYMTFSLLFPETPLLRCEDGQGQPKMVHGKTAVSTLSPSNDSNTN